MIMFAMTLMGFSCERDDDGDVNTAATLEEQYPDWANLTWVSTDGVTAEDDPYIYPRLEISISGNEGEIKHTTSNDNYYWNSFSKITITGNNITFNNSVGTVGVFTKNGNTITLTTKGLTIYNHTYVLKIN